MRIAVLLFGLSLAACATGKGAGTTSSPLPTVEVDLCRTTAAELAKRYGSPYRDGRLHRWRIQSFKIGDPKKELFLAVMLGDDGVVRDVYYDVPGAVNWVPEDQCGGGR